MKIKIYPIRSILHKDMPLEETSKKMLSDINQNGDFEFELIDDIKKVNSNDKLLIFVQSGGSENYFLKDIYPYFKGPYYLLTYKTNNSFAASLEILSFIRQKNLQGEILHGSISYIKERLYNIYNKDKEDVTRLGVLNTPSDWLISSNVDYEKAKELFNIELVDISGDILDSYVDKYLHKEYELDIKHLFDKGTIIRSYALYEGIKQLLIDYKLSGYTIRCFDVLLRTKESACFALAKLNSENIISACEGDIPALISMEVVRRLFKAPAFQANPQELYIEENALSLAHCTIPFNMVSDYKYHTHFESNMGLGIEGFIYEGEATIFKIGADLMSFYVEEGVLSQDEFSNLRCRTQVKFKLKTGDVTYFLKSSLGNHHLLIYGNKKQEIRDYLLSLGLNEIC